MWTGVGEDYGRDKLDKDAEAEGHGSPREAQNNRVWHRRKSGMEQPLAQDRHSKKIQDNAAYGTVEERSVLCLGFSPQRVFLLSCGEAFPRHILFQFV